MRRLARPVLAVVALLGLTATSAYAGPAALPPGEEPPGAAAPDRSTSGRALVLQVPVDPAVPQISLADRAGATPSGPGERPDPAAAPDDILVRFVDRTTPADRSAALRDAGLDVAAGPRPVTGTDVVRVATGDDGHAAVRRLEADPRVEAVQLDHRRGAAAWTDDPHLDYGWPSFELTRLPRAWDVETGGGIVVAVLDTGVDAAHPDLAGHVLPGVDLVNGDADASDDNGHGTMIAGVIAATGDNGQGSVGAAPDASVLPVKVLDGDAEGDDSTVAEGIAWAADHGADVITLAFAGFEESPVLRDVIADAVAQGVVLVAASGNEGEDLPLYPAAYAPEVPGFLTVSATDSQGGLTGYSSWGDAVTLAAPGDLHTTVPGGSYAFVSGTSMAAGFVAGAAALVLADASATPAQVEARLVATARDAGPRGVDPYFGGGVLDAAAALGLGTSVPLDRAPGYWYETTRGDNDVSALALPVHGQVEATLAPEGDEDWFRYDVGDGWYQVEVATSFYGMFRPAPLDLVLEVRDGAGHVLGTADDTGLLHASSEVLDVALTDGPLLVGVRNATGTVGDYRYRVTVTPRASNVLVIPRSSGARGTQYSELADLTGDGVLDMVNTIDFTLHEGLGDGTFAAGEPLGLAVRHLTLADVDGDGDTDVVGETDTGLRLHLQGAEGMTRVEPDVPLPEERVRSLDAVDWDLDGDQDLVAVSQYATTTTLFRNDGTGSFSPHAIGGGVDAWRFDVADVTGDGRPDLLTWGTMWPQRADGSLGPASALPYSASDDWSRTVTDMAFGDVDGDGRTDVVRAVASRGPSGSAVTVDSVRADGSFAPTASYPVPGSYPVAVVLGDMNHDGRPDVVLATADPEALVVLHQQADGTLASPQDLTSLHNIGGSVDHPPGSVHLGDLDGDSMTDAVATSGPRVMSYLQRHLDTQVTEAAWVTGSFPVNHAAGLGVRPTVTATLARDLDPTSVDDASVRLLDGSTGTGVPSSRSYDAATGVVSLTPSADLVPGHHYQLTVDGLLDAAGAVQDRPFRSYFTVAAGGERFTPIEPERVLDTREDGDGPVSPGSPIRLRLGGTLVPTDATAVVLNVTAAGPSGVGNVRVYPTPEGPDVPPVVSNLNVVPGVDQPNLVTVQLAGDTVSLAVDGMRTHLVADLAGYYSPGGATAYEPVDPVRVMDLRTGTGGVPVGRLGAGRWVDLQVTGRAGVPADASAVVLNLTGVTPSGATNVRAYPTPAGSEDQTPPLVSNLNLQPGRDQPNLVTVQVGDGGRVRFYSESSDPYLVADLTGYYSPTATSGFVPLAPARVADSRLGHGLAAPLVAGTTSQLRVGGVGDVPSTATAVVLNVTAVGPAGSSNVRVFPGSTTGQVPLVSNLNVVRGRDEPNLVIVPLGTAGKVSFFSQSAGLHLVADLGGYFRRTP